MTKRIFIILMVLSVSFISYAQEEEASKKIAETQHKQLASELSNALKSGKGKPVFGSDGKDKQFLLEDDQKVFADYLGWKQSQFNKRSLVSVYQGLLLATKQKDAKKKVNANISFPMNSSEFKGQATDKKGKVIKDLYLVTTTAEVTVEASKQGIEKSVAKNGLTLNWEVSLVVNKKTGAVDTRLSKAVLKSIEVEPASGFFLTERQQMQVISETLIKDYYQSLRSARWSAVEIPEEWRNPLQTSTKRDTEGDVTVSLPTTTTFEVKTVPDLKIFVNDDAYHKVALGFRIAINDDLKSGRITSVNYVELEKPKIVEPEPQPEPEPEPVFATTPAPAPAVVAQPVVRERGRTYKVQILSLTRFTELSNLPVRFRMDNVSIEKYVVGGRTYYKYMVPAGTTLNEALDVRRQMRNKGIADSWIAIYENGARVAPNEGAPELMR